MGSQHPIYRRAHSGQDGYGRTAVGFELRIARVQLKLEFPIKVVRDDSDGTVSGTRDYLYAGAVLERELNERITVGAELLGNLPVERGGRPDIAFNLGGTVKLNEHVNLLFAGGRDIIGDTHAVAYVGLQS